MLESQFDADTIPEAVTNTAESSSHDQSRLVDVYVPSFLSSQFWISYTINPAMLAPAHAPTKYMFFKLLLDGECIVSWGVGERDQWKGKTMWAFARRHDHGHDYSPVDKRAFFFRPTGDDQDFDIVAYRARARRRTCRHFDAMPALRATGFDLVNWGRLEEHHPQRFYQYALLDPVDRPYATFHYHVRGGRHCRAPASQSATDESLELIEHLPDASQVRRLSYPPAIRLAPTSSHTEPCSPMKLDPEDSTMLLCSELSVTSESLPTSAQHIDSKRTCSVDTAIYRNIHTPTSIRSDHDVISTPPSSLGKRSGAKIKEWFGSLSKRRSTRSTSPIRPSLSHKASSTSLS
jgi:hypothetical protein